MIAALVGGVAAVSGSASGGPVASKAAGAAAENGRIIFRQRTPPATDFDIYTMKSDGSGTALLLGGATDDRDAAFSPDGKKVVFRRNSPTAELVDIYTMNAEGSNPVNLTAGVSDSARFPTFSPDGKRIAFELRSSPDSIGTSRS